MTHQNETTALARTTPSTTELAQFGEMPVQAIVARKKKIHEVLEQVMTEGEHYGKIPGLRRQAVAVQGGRRGARHDVRARADVPIDAHGSARRSSRVRDHVHAEPHRDRRGGRRGRRQLLDDGEQVPLAPRRAEVPEAAASKAPC
jgi:hypothetical protein